MYVQLLPAAVQRPDDRGAEQRHSPIGRAIRSTNFTSQFTTSYYDSNTNGSIITYRPGNGASGINVNVPIALLQSAHQRHPPPMAASRWRRTTSPSPVRCRCSTADTRSSSRPVRPGRPARSSSGGPTAACSTPPTRRPSPPASGYFYVAGSTARWCLTVQVSLAALYGAAAALNCIRRPAVQHAAEPEHRQQHQHLSLRLQHRTACLRHLHHAAAQRSAHRAYARTSPQATTFTCTSPRRCRAPPACHSPAPPMLDYFPVPARPTTPRFPSSSAPCRSMAHTLVAVNDTPGVIFSKPMDPVSVNSTTFQILNGATPLAGSFFLNSTDTRVEFVPNAPLPAGAHAHHDAQRRPRHRWATRHELQFKLHDRLRSGLHRANCRLHQPRQQTRASRSTPSITVQFSESMDVTTFNQQLRSLRQPAGHAHSGNVTWSSDQPIAYLTPNVAACRGPDQYYFYVSSGSDLAGNQMSGKPSTFTPPSTGVTPPTVVNFNPISGKTGLGTNVRSKRSSARRSIPTPSAA